MKTFLISIICCATSFGEENPKPFFTREWSFPSEKGSVQIRLTQKISPRDPFISAITFVYNGAFPNIKKEAELLKIVLEDMKKEELFPEKVWSIYIEFGGTNSKELALAAAKSPEWAKASENDYPKLIVQLLNSINAYAPFNRVFENYKLNVRVVGAEHIMLSKSTEIGLENSPLRMLPSEASIQLGTKRIGAQ